MAAGTNIQVKRKSSAFSSSDLAVGELGWDYTNKYLYSSSNGTDILKIGGSDALFASDNLDSLSNYATARSNLGLGAVATANVTGIPNPNDLVSWDGTNFTSRAGDEISGDYAFMGNVTFENSIAAGGLDVGGEDIINASDVVGDSNQIILRGALSGTGIVRSNTVGIWAASPDGTVALDVQNTGINWYGASSIVGSITSSGLQLGNANARVTTILDEDTMVSDSATALATQQSIKAYVDSWNPSTDASTTLHGWNSSTGWQSLDGQDISGGYAFLGTTSFDDVESITMSGELNMGDNTLSNVSSITRTGTLTSTASSNNILQTTAGGTVHTTTSNATLTAPDGVTLIEVADNSITLTPEDNPMIDITADGFRVFETGPRINAILDQDDMSSNSATALATQQSIKAYVDANAGGGLNPVAAALIFG